MKKLDIIFENKDIIVINKPTKLLTIKTNKNEQTTLYSLVSDYLKKQNPHNKVFIVHRLDKDTSGIILFAKNKKIKDYLQNNWNKICIKRKYYGIVSGKLKEFDHLENYLAIDNFNQVYVTNKKNNNLAITEYKVINTNKLYSLLDIEIFTGKKNQIRAQLAYINHPLVGDKKYNKNKSSINRLALHSYLLEINIYNKKYVFKTDIPDSFLKLINIK